MKSLPKIGYLALMNNHPIAAGFLRRVEGGYGQIDTLASNRHFGSLVRHEGISKVVNELINEAKLLKLHGIVSYTHDDGILKRANALGFQESISSVITLKLP